MRLRKGIGTAGATRWQDREVLPSGEEMAPGRQLPINKANATHGLADDQPADATCAAIVVPGERDADRRVLPEPQSDS